jgi:hypothetical protein
LRPGDAAILCRRSLRSATLAATPSQPPSTKARISSIGTASNHNSVPKRSLWARLSFGGTAGIEFVNIIETIEAEQAEKLAALRSS